MERNELAEQLKERHRQRKLTPEDVLQLLTDDQIIGSYVKCSECNAYLLDETDLESSINAAKDAQDFLDITQKYADAIHKHDNPKLELIDNTGVPHYTITLASYYDQRSNGTIEICRMTVLVCDLWTDTVVLEKEYWLKDYPHVNLIMDNSQKITKKYWKKKNEGVDFVIIEIPKPLPLEKCSCGKCEGYLSNHVSRADFLQGSQSMDMNDLEVIEFLKEQQKLKIETIEKEIV